MTQRIYLHVGSPKTGTTFLQQVLWSQREKAEEQGLHLPLDRFHDHFLASLDVRGMAGKDPHPPESEGAWNRLVADARTRPGSVLVSHELFAAANDEHARQAVAWLGSDVEVHIVLTARDLVRQMTAEWQEHVKHRAVRSLEDFVAQLRRQAPERQGWFWLVQDYAGVAARWGARLPASQVHVVTVPPAGAPGDLLWERFAGLLGLDPASFDTQASRSNTSLGREQVEVLRRVNATLGDRLPVPGPYPAVVKDVLAHRILARRDGTRLTLTPADADFALAESRRVADELAAAGVDVVGSLDDLVPDAAAVEAVSDDAAYDTPSDKALLEESIAALGDLLEVMARRDETQRRQAEVVDSLQRSPLRAALNQASEGRPALEKARGAFRRFRQH